jgi:ubiquinone/menaquinone biosynthesis C-methylase UbiE
MNENRTAKTGPFDVYSDRYDHWFDVHRALYVSELLALRTLVPCDARGLEIGVGTGRFAGPLGVAIGIDPSEAMLMHAAARGVETVKGIAEALPFSDGSFDYTLVVTTICFVQSADRMLAEARRVLRPNGKLIIGFVNRQSGIGRGYLKHQSESVFYREAVFYSVAEVGELLEAQGFNARIWGQTLFRPLAEITRIEPVRPGTDEGAFVVVMANRPRDAVRNK